MISTLQQFGGTWTDDKLDRVRKYLQEYTKIFNVNPRAQKLHTIYVDAFAGTGYRNPKTHPDIQPYLFSELGDTDNQVFLKGSARIALEVEPPFKEYLFIEHDPGYVSELNRLKKEFPDRQITIVNSESNSYLQNWVTKKDWRFTRSVVFLDPYGMEVEWKTIETLGQTKAIDLWLLFPLGVAVNRLLTKSGPPPQIWSDKLTRIFGTDEWQSVFYTQKTIHTLFGEEEIQQREADFDNIGQFFVSRLKEAFFAVSPQPLPLMNSRNIPLYLLCFAAANPQVAPTALRIANYLLKR